LKSKAIKQANKCEYLKLSGSVLAGTNLCSYWLFGPRTVAAGPCNHYSNLYQ